MVSTRLASLGMYDCRWTAAANDALWAAIAVRLRREGVSDVPARLERSRPLDEVIADPALLFGQTCGYPLMTRLRGAVRLVSTARYDLPGCTDATHRSFLIVRAEAALTRLDELRGATAAINALDSNTGMNLLRAAVAPLAGGGKFFGRIVMTGSHLASVAAVADRQADVAAIDCVTHGLAARHRPDLLLATRVLGETVATPALPFVTAVGTADLDVAALRRVLAEIDAEPTLAPLRRSLGLAGFERLDQTCYEQILQLERDAVAAGYLRLQ